MKQAIQASLMPDGRRMHLHNGPIDLIIEAYGPRKEVLASYRQGTEAFEGCLEKLVDELPLLRSPITELETELYGAVAKNMVAAVRPHGEAFVTPMAAVAGAVADTILTAMIDGRTVSRAYVNNGGDIALHLTPGEKLRTGMVTNLKESNVDGLAEIRFEAPVRGIATSGWSGRSFSLGIADSVTVLAQSAAAADVAATLIANAVDVDHVAVARTPAREMDPDSDLDGRLVTVGVGTLEEDCIELALQSGISVAGSMRERGLIEAASLTLQGRTQVVDHPDAVLERKVA